jgi:hypothetical protein
MSADGEDRRPGAAGGSERLRLQADLLAAEERTRQLRARLQRTETELERAREDLAAERDDRARDAEWFRDALGELRTAAEQTQETERAAEELRAALNEAHQAIGARDALLAELRDELDRRVRAESETLSALDALRERAATAPPPAHAAPEPAPPRGGEPATDPEPPAHEPAAETAPPEPPAGKSAMDTAPPKRPALAAEPPGEAAPLPGGGRFDRRPPWPEGTAELARAEIDWQAGYINSRFRAVVYHPNRKRGTIAATGSNYKWLLMGEPAPESPEFVAEVERLAAALEDAGWEEIGEGGVAWFSRRYVWRHAPPAPDELRPKPLEAFQRS